MNTLPAIIKTPLDYLGKGVNAVMPELPNSAIGMAAQGRFGQVVPAIQNTLNQMGNNSKMLMKHPQSEEELRNQIGMAMNGVIGSIGGPETPEAKFGNALRESGQGLEQVGPRKYLFNGPSLNAKATSGPLPEFEAMAGNPRKLIRK